MGNTTKDITLFDKYNRLCYKYWQWSSYTPTIVYLYFKYTKLRAMVSNGTIPDMPLVRIRKHFIHYKSQA